MRQCIPRFALPCFASTLYCSLSPCHRLHIFHFSNNLHSHSLSICRTNGIMQIGHTKLFHISNVYVHMFIEPLSASHAVPDCSIQLAFWGTHTTSTLLSLAFISIVLNCLLVENCPGLFILLSNSFPDGAYERSMRVCPPPLTMIIFSMVEVMMFLVDIIYFR